MTESAPPEIPESLGPTPIGAEVFRYFFDNTPQPALLVSCDGIILNANRSAAALLGDSTETLPGRAMGELCTAEHVWQTHCDATLAGDSGQTCDINLPGGASVQLHSVALRNSGKRPQAIACTFQEIGAARQREQEQQTCAQELAAFQRLFADGPVVLFQWLPHSGWPVASVTENVRELSGYPAEEFLSGRIPYAVLVHSEDFPRLVGDLDAAAQARQDRLPARAYRIVHKSGEIRWVLAYTRLHWSGDGRLEHYQGYVVDISEARQQWALPDHDKIAAEQAGQAQSRFLADLGRELRTPLDSILGFSQMLLSDASLENSHHSALTNIRHAGEHLLKLSADILDLAKIEAGKITLKPRPCMLPELLLEITETMRARAEGKEVILAREFAVDLPSRVSADAPRLRQILFNLLANAIKFTRRGKITFKVFPKADKIHFEVIDTGDGIDAARPHDIFAPFRQSGGESTGLGLTISRHLAQLMGGELAAHSSLGQGSTFSFALALPAAGPDEHAQTLRIIKDYEGPRRNILVVEDEALNRALLVNTLRNLGFLVTEADGGEQALDLAARHRPDLVLVDIVMPGVDGLETTRRLRQLPGCADVPILAVSASVFEQHRRDSLSAGCNDFLGKPVDLQVLCAKLAVWLQLQWIYETRAGNDFQARSGEISAPPPQAVLEHLLALVMRGDISSLIRESAAMLREAPQYTAFIQELIHLADAFELRKLEAYIQSYMSTDKEL